MTMKVNRVTDIIVPAFEHCVNCGREVKNTSGDSVACKVEVFETFIQNKPVNVSVSSALKEIFAGFLNLSRVDNDDDKSELLSLCADCCLIFSQLYGLFHLFGSRRRDGTLLCTTTWKRGSKHQYGSSSNRNTSKDNKIFPEQPPDPCQENDFIEIVVREPSGSLPSDSQEQAARLTSYSAFSPEDDDSDPSLPENRSPSPMYESWDMLEKTPHNKTGKIADELTGELQDSFTTAKNLRVGSVPTSGKLIIRCTDCPEEFQTVVQLGNHRHNVHHSDQYSCHICSWTCSRGASLRNHLLHHQKQTLQDSQKIHIRPSELTCKYCSRKFRRERPRKLHEKNCPKNTKHVPGKRYGCRVSSVETNQHRNDPPLHSRPQQGTVVSEFGEISTNGNDPTSNSEQQSENIIVTGDGHAKSEPDYKLGGEFKEATPDLDARTLRESAGDSDHEPSASDTDEESPSTSRKSRKPKSEIPSTVYKCIDCDSVFSSAVLLGRHRSNEHEAENPFQCHVCPASFTHGSNLTQHLKRHNSTRNIKCKYCDKYFRVEHDYKRHALRIHHVKITVKSFLTQLPQLSHYSNAGSLLHQVFRCIRCQAEFPESASLAQHYRSIHKDTTYECNLCPKIYLTYEGSKKHQEWHEQLHLKCDFCDDTFTSQQSLQNHLYMAHDEGSSCPPTTREATSTPGKKHCSPNSPDKARSSADPANPQDDMPDLPNKLHSEGADKFETLQCSECPLQFDTSSALGSHRNRCHNDLNPHPCQTCGKKFSTVDTLKDHQKVHNRIKCPFCDHRGPESKMKTHTLREHPEKYAGLRRLRRVSAAQSTAIKILKRKTRATSIVYTCFDCREEFSSGVALAHHRKDAHDAGFTPFKCYICASVLRTQYKLRLHIGKHNESSDWPCGECPCRFLMRKGRNDHLFSIHGIRKDPSDPFPLPPGKTIQFLTPTEENPLATHKRGISIHKGAAVVRDYKCCDCDEGFTGPMPLGIHRNLLHGAEGRERFKCHICLKSYTTPVGLCLHILRHKDVRDYLCEQCGKGFKTRDDLKQHYDLNHSEDGRAHLKSKWERSRLKRKALRHGEVDDLANTEGGRRRSRRRVEGQSEESGDPTSLG